MLLQRRKEARKKVLLPRLVPGPRQKSYFYSVKAGNNSRLVLAALKERPWLRPQPKGTSPKQQKLFVWEMYRTQSRYANKGLLSNHLEGNGSLVTKKGLHRTMTTYFGDATSMPESFHIESTNTDAFRAFQQTFQAQEEKAKRQQEEPDEEEAPVAPEKRRRRRRVAEATNVRIVKPASYANRGFGIRVSNSLDEIATIVESEARADARCGGWIVQKYIEEPLLIQGRKFDIRVFVLLVCDDPQRTRTFVHRKATYLRTSSEPYSLSLDHLKNRFLHLTNDGVQKKSPKYGRFEPGNKLTMDQFQDYMTKTRHLNENYVSDVLQNQIDDLVLKTVEASSHLLNPAHRKNSFELLGYDFMLDDDLNVYLIEINSNPCLDLCCPHLDLNLPLLISDTLQVGLDALLPPPTLQEATSSDRYRQAIQALQDRHHSFEELFLATNKKEDCPAVE